MARNGVGRPKLFDDRLRVNFPAPLMAFIEREAERRMVPMGQIVRDAVQAQMEKENVR